MATAHFSERLQAQKPLTWKPDTKRQMEMARTYEEAEFALEEGILSHLRAKRMRELEAYTVKNCWKNKNYNYLQAEKCESFHLQNDYKLGLLQSFTKDHLWKHSLSHETCWKNGRFEALDRIEKDREFVKCHEKWVSNMREKVVPDLEQRAKEPFGRSD